MQPLAFWHITKRETRIFKYLGLFLCDLMLLSRPIDQEKLSDRSWSVCESRVGFYMYAYYQYYHHQVNRLKKLSYCSPVKQNLSSVTRS